MGYSSPIPPTSLASLSHRQLSTEHLYRFFNCDSLMTIFSHTCKLNPSCSLTWMIFHQNTIKTTVCLVKNSHHHPFLPPWKSSAVFQSYTTNKTSTNSYSPKHSPPWVDQVEVIPPLPLPSEGTPTAPSNNRENHQTTHGTIENYHGYPTNDGPWKMVFFADTVDGSEIRLTSWYGSLSPYHGNFTSQVVVWDFCHQQYHGYPSNDALDIFPFFVPLPQQRCKSLVLWQRSMLIRWCFGKGDTGIFKYWTNWRLSMHTILYRVHFEVSNWTWINLVCVLGSIPLTFHHFLSPRPVPWHTVDASEIRLITCYL